MNNELIERIDSIVSAYTEGGKISSSMSVIKIMTDCKAALSEPVKDGWTFDELDLRGPADFETTPPEGWESSDWRTCLELKAELHNKKVYRAEIKRLRAALSQQEAEPDHVDLEMLARCADSGPWRVSAPSPAFGYWHVVRTLAAHEGGGNLTICSLPALKKSEGGEITHANAAFIAAASPDVVLGLIAEIRRFCAKPAPLPQPVASVPQDVEEFIAAFYDTIADMDSDTGECRVIYPEDLRAWMAGHARVPVEFMKSLHCQNLNCMKGVLYLKGGDIEQCQWCYEFAMLTASKGSGK